jgi:ribosomal protein S18 acetylase RimI-like enzyme
MAIHIRPIRFPEEYSYAVSLWEKCGPGVRVGVSDSLEETRRKLERDPDLFLVAEEHDRVVGTVIGGFDGRRGMIYHLAVEPAQRGRGIARALMTEVETRLKNLGCRKAYLMMIPDNPAGDFYRQSGWEEMDVSIFSKSFGDLSC